MFGNYILESTEGNGLSRFIGSIREATLNNPQKPTFFSKYLTNNSLSGPIKASHSIKETTK